MSSVEAQKGLLIGFTDELSPSVFRQSIQRARSRSVRGIVAEAVNMTNYGRVSGPRAVYLPRMRSRPRASAHAQRLKKQISLKNDIAIE